VTTIEKNTEASVENVEKGTSELGKVRPLIPHILLFCLLACAAGSRVPQLVSVQVRNPLGRDHHCAGHHCGVCGRAAKQEPGSLQLESKIKLCVSCFVSVVLFSHATVFSFSQCGWRAGGGGGHLW
jgi:hypothetical protein